MSPSSYTSTTVRPTNLVRAVRSEWIKYWTLASSYWIIATTVVLMVGIGALFALMMTSIPEEAAADVPPVDVSTITSGYLFGQNVVAVLGVMIASSEYTTGQIRSTFASNPTRTPVWLAKIVVTGVIAFLVGTVAIALSWLAANPILSSSDMAIDMSADHSWRMLIGAPLYLTVIALMGLGIGFLLRSTAGAITVVTILVFVLPIVTSAISLEWLQELSQYLPSNAGGLIMQADPGGDLSPWQGFGILGAWAGAALVGALIRIKATDA